MLNTTIYSIIATLQSHLPWPTPLLLPILAALSGLLLILTTSYGYFFPPDNSATNIHRLGGSAVANAWAFFNERYDFLRSNFDKTGHESFSFKMFHYQIVAVSGDEARKTFYNDKDLNFEQGYCLLRGGIPKLTDIKVVGENSSVNALNRRLLKILHRDRLQDVMSTLFSDIHRRMEAWGTDGKMNPFKDIYDLVFQMTVRIASCEELATDPIAVQKVTDLYWMLEKSITPVGLLLPWFPGRAQKLKKQATKGLYDLLLHYVNIRRKAEVRNSDAIDVLIADGEDDHGIVEFALSLIFAGIINTGMISCWILFYLGANNEWKDKVVAEVRNLITKYTDVTSAPIHQRLSMIQISAWEDEMPVMDNVIRETLRIVKNGPALRRNLADNLQIADMTIDKGAFVVYSMADVHLNDAIYPNPLKFDPGRFSSPREEDKRGDTVFLGWGAGRHPCSGMKVAKLEIKMIIALFLSGYSYKLVDASGKPPKQFPQPNRNDMHQARPMGEPCFIQYQKIAE